MSPEITFYTRGRSNPDVVDLPDETGIYHTEIGEFDLDMSGVNPRNEVQILKLMDRETMLSAQGVGSVQISPDTRASIRLHEPIRREGEWFRVRRKSRRGSKHIAWIPKDPSLRTEADL